MFNIADDRATGIMDPNFIWMLLGQLFIGFVGILLSGWLLYKMLYKLMPKTKQWIRMIIVASLLILMVSILGIVTEYFNLVVAKYIH